MAIWWAAWVLAPIQPVMMADTLKAPTSNIICAPMGRLRASSCR